jgi:acyl carrier protein
MVETAKVLEIVAASGLVQDMSKFDPNKTFRENEVDSLDVLSIFLAVEEQLGVKFSDEEASQINSVAKIVEVINSR